MEDGSEFLMPSQEWQKALELKYGEKANSLALKKIFIKRVAEYWRKRKVPTKFDWDENWKTFFKTTEWEEFKGKRTFQNQAELAFLVMYYEIRAPLLSIAFRKLSKKGKVIALSEKEFTVYNGETKRKYKNFEDVFKRKNAKN